MEQPQTQAPVPPSSTPAFVNPITPPTPSAKPKAPRFSRRLFLLIGLPLLVIALGVGAYFANAQGLISIPFLPANDGLDTAIDEWLNVKSGRSQVEFSMVNEARTAGVQPMDFNLLNIADTDTSASQQLEDNVVSSVGQFLPKDAVLIGTLTGLFNSNKTELFANTESSLTGAYEADGEKVSIGYESKIVDKKIYLKLTQLPDSVVSGSLNLAPYMNKWIRIDSDTLTWNATGWPEIDKLTQLAQNYSDNIDLDQTKLQRVATEAIKAAINDKILIVKKKLKDEKVGTETARHQQLGIDSSRAASTYQAAVSAMNKVEGLDKYKVDPAVTKMLQSDNFKTFMQQMDQSMTLDVWFSKKTNLPIKMSLNMRLVPPESETDMAGQQVRVNVSLTYSDVNKELAVTAPTDSISIDQLAIGLLSLPEAQLKRSAQIGRIVRLRDALKQYYKDNNSYPDNLDQLVPKYYTKSPTDTVTNASYTYAKSADSETGYTISYNMLPTVADEDSGTDIFAFLHFDAEAIDGVNTANANTFSVEADALPTPTSNTLCDRSIEGALCDTTTDTITGDITENTTDTTTDGLTEDNPGNEDADGDGLTTFDETQYGTDSSLADTDGDGYSDKEEIDSGYNPLGDGRLNAATSTEN